MKKNLLILGFAILAFQNNSFALSTTNRIYAFTYEAEGTQYYQVTGCVAGSDVAFYSTPQGGVELSRQVTDNNGALQVAGSKDFSPAFAVSIPDPNKANVRGTGMVSFIGDKEFTMSKVGASSNGENVTISWNAAVNDPGNYTFELLKSINGVVFSAVNTQGATTLNMIGYSFDDNLSSGTDAWYEVRITGKNGVTYTSQPIYVNNGSGISLYPTITSNVINLQLSAGNQNPAYKILNQEGQVLKSGTLTSSLSTLSVADFVPGNYLVQVAGSKTTTLKFVKK